jgi:hypothetical protein
MTAPAYVVNVQHRNSNPNKSQWVITPDQERAVFLRAHESGWLLPTVGWGLHVLEGAATYLGLSTDRERQLVVAKFVGGQSPIDWHGYPADHEVHPQDIPEEFVLDRWLSQGVLPAPKVRKIGKAQRCRL